MIELMNRIGWKRRMCRILRKQSGIKWLSNSNSRRVLTKALKWMVLEMGLALSTTMREGSTLGTGTATEWTGMALCTTQTVESHTRVNGRMMNFMEKGSWTTRSRIIFKEATISPLLTSIKTNNSGSTTTGGSNMTRNQVMASCFSAMDRDMSGSSRMTWSTERASSTDKTVRSTKVNGKPTT